MKPIYKRPTLLLSLILCVGIASCQSDLHSYSTAQAVTVSDSPVSTSVNVPTDLINNQNTAAPIGNTVPPKAPWNNPAIHNSETDATYRQEWAKSESKSLCPILALPKQAAAHLTHHSVRRANFSSGWGVAYDLPNVRSAYGVANASTADPKDAFNNWPYNIVYKDGSLVGYGHEGGDPSAKWLAYIFIPQNSCFYNVWSAQSKTHLEQIISELRIVQN